MLLANCFWCLTTSYPVNALPPSETNAEIRNLSECDATYSQFSGPAQNFPNVATWTRYDVMWNREYTFPNTAAHPPKISTLTSVVI
jgi:hypothetical protein